MQGSLHGMTWTGRMTTLLAGLALLATAGCSAAEDTDLFDEIGASGLEEVDQSEQAITGGWTTLTLVNGWTNYWGAAVPPAVGVVNGVVTFRGALNGSNATSDIAFYLPAQFRPYFQYAGQTHVGTDIISVRVAMAGTAQGTLQYVPDLFGGQGNPHAVRIIPDNPSSGSPKSFVSLDGVTFDRTVDNSTPLQPDPSWSPVYARRLQGPHTAGAYVKNVDGFVRFQGYLTSSQTFPGYLFTLPSQYRTNETVSVPVNLEGSWGYLSIYPSGDVYVGGNPPAAANGTSLEGAFYSRTLSGNSPLALVNGWSAYSTRAVRVGKNDDVVRFQGAISGGTSGTLATLPSNMRPSKPVTLLAVAYGGVPARIVVNTNGNVTVDTTNPPLWVSSLYLSLDGLSFAL